MAHIIDDIARILATPVPRRQAFRLLGRVLAGGFVGALGLKAQTVNSLNSNSGVICGNTRCQKNQTCCTQGQGAYRPFCASQGKSCCGNSTMNSNQQCCRSGSSPFVAAKNQNCCGNGACNSGQTCCTSSSRPFCAPSGATCCGTMTCKSGETCCGNNDCCSQHETCDSKTRRCRASNGSH